MRAEVIEELNGQPDEIISAPRAPRKKTDVYAAMQKRARTPKKPTKKVISRLKLTDVIKGGSKHSASKQTYDAIAARKRLLAEKASRKRNIKAAKALKTRRHKATGSKRRK